MRLLLLFSDNYSIGIKESHPENWQDMDLDERVLYNTSGGMSHGRVAIASGAVKKAVVLSAARATNMFYHNPWYTLFLTDGFCEDGRRATGVVPSWSI